MAKTLKDEPEKEKKLGRPTKYKPEYCKFARGWMLLHGTQEGLAEVLSVDLDTITNWKKEYPEFEAAVNEGGDVADMNVANALYSLAVGTTQKQQKPFLDQSGEVVIANYEESIAPNYWAANTWLRNRNRKWRRDNDESGDGGNAQSITFNFNPVPNKPYVKPDTESVPE